MNNQGHVRILKNALLFEAEKEREIRSDIIDRINKNSMTKHDDNILAGSKEGGLI